MTYSGEPPYKLRRLSPSYPYVSKLRERCASKIETLSEGSARDSLEEEDVSEAMATGAFLATRLYLPSVLPQRITTLTFLDHFKKSRPLPNSDKRLNPIFYRLAYIRDLVGEMELEGIVERGTASRLLGASSPAGFVAGTYTHARDLSKTMSLASVRDAVLAIEAQTRDQSESQLWALLRRGLATASTMKWGHSGRSTTRSGARLAPTPRESQTTPLSSLDKQTNGRPGLSSRLSMSPALRLPPQTYWWILDAVNALCLTSPQASRETLMPVAY